MYLAENTIDDDDFKSLPFYRRPQFFVPIILLTVIILMAIVFNQYSNNKKLNEGRPYTGNSVLIFPIGTEDWKFVGTSSYYCLIDGNWRECFPLVTDK